MVHQIATPDTCLSRECINNLVQISSKPTAPNQFFFPLNHDQYRTLFLIPETTLELDEEGNSTSVFVESAQRRFDLHLVSDLPYVSYK